MFSELQQAYGLSWTCNGLLSNKELRPFLDPAQVMTWDWLHSMLQHGVLTHEVSLLLEACRSVGVMRRDVELFLQDASWQFCHVHKAKCRQLHRVFSHWRTSGEHADKLNVSARDAQAFRRNTSARYSGVGRQTGIILSMLQNC
jgi:hypothetical protein